MHRGFFLVRPASYLVAALLAVAMLSSRTPADEIEVSLNVLYSDPLDNMSGGSWQIAAKSDGFGIAGLQLLLTGIDFGSEQLVAPRGLVNVSDPAGMSLLDKFTHPLGFREVDVIQRPVIGLLAGEEQSIFYGIGTLTNGTPDVLLPGGYDSLTGAVSIPWAEDPPGDVLGDSNWNSAAVLVTGTFSAEMTPAFYADGSNVSSGNLYTSLGTETMVGAQTFIEELMTTVRTNLLPDYNGNGKVDAADYTLWRDAYTNATPLNNDTTPGIVDESDYTVWRQFFGATVPGSGAGSGAGLAVAVVPEPTTWTLLLGATGMLLLRPKNGLLRKVRFR